MENINARASARNRNPPTAPDEHRTERKRLDNRRASLSLNIEVGGLRYTVTVGRYADGTIGEIFLQNHKPGSQSDSNARDAAVAASLALQFGCPLETLRHALLRDSHGRPSTPLGAALDRLCDLEAER
jgi:hypothetical protein